MALFNYQRLNLETMFFLWLVRVVKLIKLSFMFPVKHSNVGIDGFAVAAAEGAWLILSNQDFQM